VFMLTTWLGFSEQQVNRVIQRQLGIPLSEATPGESADSDDQASEHDSLSPEENNGFPLNLGKLGFLSRILGLGILVFSATGVFAQLQYSLNRIWEVKPDPEQGGAWNFISKRILSIGIVLVIGFLLLVSLVLTAALNQIVNTLGGSSPGIQIVSTVVHETISLCVATVLFAAIFKVLPDARIPWRDVWVGAGATALLFVMGKMLIGWYLANSQVGADWGSSAASVVGALIWVYYSSLIVLFGAELTEVWSNQFGQGSKPLDGAAKVIKEVRLVPAKVEPASPN
jgi:membrane protein